MVSPEQTDSSILRMGLTRIVDTALLSAIAEAEVWLHGPQATVKSARIAHP